MIEKRKFERLKEPLNIRYYVIGGGPDAPYQLQNAEIVDSGKGGVLFKTDKSLEKGMLVEMELMLPLRPGAESFKRAVVLGWVVWATAPGVGAESWGEYGVEFVHVDTDMQEDIERFIASRLASSGAGEGEG